MAQRQEYYRIEEFEENRLGTKPPKIYKTPPRPILHKSHAWKHTFAATVLFIICVSPLVWVAFKSMHARAEVLKQNEQQQLKTWEELIPESNNRLDVEAQDSNRVEFLKLLNESPTMTKTDFRYDPIAAERYRERRDAFIRSQLSATQSGRSLLEDTAKQVEDYNKLCDEHPEWPRVKFNDLGRVVENAPEK